MWTNRKSFFTLIKNGWEVEIGDSGLFRLARKLKSIESSLRDWNKNIFGNTENNIQELEQRIEILEQDLQLSFSKDTKSDLLTSKVEIGG